MQHLNSWAKTLTLLILIMDSHPVGSLLVIGLIVVIKW